MTNLFLDDLRDPPGNPLNWVVCRSFYEAVGYVHVNGLNHLTLISFDHDLGDSYGRESIPGYGFAVWLTELDFRAREKLDRRNQFCQDFRFRLHSSNPVGRANIRSLFDRYFTREFEETVSRETHEVPSTPSIGRDEA